MKKIEFRILIDEIDKPQADPIGCKWVDVNEEMPLFTGSYIVWASYGRWEFAEMYLGGDQKKHWAFSKDELNLAKLTVTHWLKMVPPQ
jgi:hypothetical protein